MFDNRDAYGLSDDDIRKLNKTFETHFAKIKFKGGIMRTGNYTATSTLRFASTIACRRQSP